jgi:hypothetical protein
MIRSNKYDRISSLKIKPKEWMNFREEIAIAPKIERLPGQVEVPKRPKLILPVPSYP